MKQTARDLRNAIVTIIIMILLFMLLFGHNFI